MDDEYMRFLPKENKQFGLISEEWSMKTELVQNIQLLRRLRDVINQVTSRRESRVTIYQTNQTQGDKQGNQTDKENTRD